MSFAVGDLWTANAANLASIPFYGEAPSSASPVTLSSAAPTNFVPTSSAVQITLPSTRRVSMRVRARFGQRSATAGNYLLLPSYNVGAFGGTIIPVGGGATVNCNGNGAQFDEDATCDATVLLTAGTYTFYPVARRLFGGATDVVALGYCALYDAGPV